MRRLMHTIVAAALVLSPALVVAAETLETRLAPCLACHGEKGQSVKPEVPSLGGQPEFYLTVQLLMFRDRLRAVDVMNKTLLGFSNDDLRNTAAFLAKLPPPQSGGTADPARVEKARAIIGQNHCNVCHDRDFAGQQNVPRLAGQREDYLVKALREHKDNTRRGYDASMADVIYHISDEQIADLAYFLARLR